MTYCSRRSVIRSLGVMAILTSAACAGAARQAAIKLADDGLAASKQTEALLTQTSGTLQPYVEGQYLLAPIRDTEPPSAMLLKNIDTAEKALALRIGVMTNLAKAYTAMKNHASHDAGAAVEKGVADLTGGVNAYLQLFPGAELIPDAAAFVMSKAAGASARKKQTRQLHGASAAIRNRIATFREALTREADTLASIQKVTASTTGTNVLVFWNLGIGQPDAILRQYVESYGLQFDPKQFGAVISSLEKEVLKDDPPAGCPTPCNTRAARLRFGVSQVVQYRVNRAMTLGQDVIKQHAEALSTLETAHRDFEAGRYVDAAALAADLETLGAIVDQLIALRSR